jgi:hypothetical protein
MGTVVANTYMQSRANDGADAPMSYTPGTNPGDWRPTGSGSAVTPQWGNVRPFAMTSGSQFRPPPPAGATSMAALLASSTYAAQLNEVKGLGSQNSTTRTADQTQIAFFWANDLNGTYKPPGQLFDHTQALSRAKALSKLANIKLFALVAFSMADAAIAAWDTKYNTDIDLWRPETAIKLADQDGNPATTRDLDWTPLPGFSPAFPAYVSGHATFAGAWASVMRFWFGTDNVTFTGGTNDPGVPVGTTRTFTSFTAAAAENARSRIYLGVHYQFDADNGVATGTKVGDNATAKAVQPNHVVTDPDTDPPIYRIFAGKYGPLSKCQLYGQRPINEHRWSSYYCERDFSQPDLYNLYIW